MHPTTGLHCPMHRTTSVHCPTHPTAYVYYPTHLTTGLQQCPMHPTTLTNASPASVQCTTVVLGSAFLHTHTQCFGDGHFCFSKWISGGHNANGVEVLLHYSECLYEVTAFQTRRLAAAAWCERERVTEKVGPRLQPKSRVFPSAFAPQGFCFASSLPTSLQATVLPHPTQLLTAHSPDCYQCLPSRLLIIFCSFSNLQPFAFSLYLQFLRYNMTFCNASATKHEFQILPW